MPTFELTTTDGRSFRIDADSLDLAQKAFSQAFSGAPAVAPEPPPGVVVHDVNRSYVTGGGPSVDTKGMDQPARNLAAAALERRQNAPFSMQALAPAFQGVSAGFGDEAVSAARGLTSALTGGSFGGAYNLAQEVQRQQLAQERAEHPVRSAVGQIGGALATAPAFGTLFPAVAGAPLAARMLAGAGTGGAYGAAEGFGSGSGLVDRLKQAGVGGLLGAGIGGAVPVAIEGVKAAANKALDYTSITKALQQLGIGRPAGDAVMRSMAADDAFAGSGAANIAAAGPQGMLVDAGPAARGALDAAAQSGGPAARIARQATDQRGVQANQDLVSALNAVLGGPPQGVGTMTSGIRQGTQAARRTAYDAAYAAPIDYSAPLARDLETALTRVPAKAVAKANELMQVEGAQSQQIMANIAADGSVVFERMPDVRQIDYITRGLRHLAEAGEDAGALGGRTDFSRSYTNLSQDIRGTLRQLVPEYGTALETAADPIARVQATRLGAEMLRPGMARDEVVAAVKGMTGPERQAMQQGIRSHIDELMANVKAAASDPNQDARETWRALNQLNSRAVKEKLAAVLDPAQADALATEIGRATKAAELYAGMNRNSATYGRMAVAEVNKELQQPGAVGSLMEGRPLQATQRGLQFLFGRTPQDKVAATDEMNKQIAEVLTGARGPAALAELLALSRAYASIPRNQQLSQDIAAPFGIGIGLGGYQLGRQR